MSVDSNKFLEAVKLLDADFTSIEKFESVRNLVKGFNPKIDILLEKCSAALEKIENLKNGEVINLSAEGLPAETEEQKRRKKAIIFFLKNYRELKSEVERVKAEFQNQQGSAQTSKNILSHARGPLGVLTLAAIIIVVATAYVKSQKVTKPPTSPAQASPSIVTQSPPTPTPSPSPALKHTIRVINFGGKKIPLTELYVGNGSDCDSSHYHAANHSSVKALDGSTIPDPGGCGFGRTKDVPVEEVSAP